MRKNEPDVEITRPLKQRPNVIVVRNNGHAVKILGDGDLFSTEEVIALHGGLAPSTRERLRYTEAEQADLDAANARRARAQSVLDGIWHESAALGKKIEDFMRASADDYGNPRGTVDQSEAFRLKEAAREIQSRMDEARKVLEAAMRERNAVERRIQAAANARQRPLQFHTPRKTTDERLDDLQEKRK